MAIFNLAAETHVDRSIDNPKDFIKSNILGVNNLLNFCVSSKINNFIQISTDEVYGSSETEFYNENQSLNPSSPYSASKASADMICNSYKTTFGLNIKTIRPANNYGIYQQPEKLIPFSISNLVEKKELEIYGDGKNIRHWLSVKDTVSAVKFIMEKGEQNEIYNIVPIECYICYEQISEIYTSCGHYYCKKCLETHYTRNNIRCPYCRKENNENDLSLINYLKN